MARKKPGAYAPLSAYYADDERIMEVGEAAELLYLRMLAYCARTPKTEGYVSLAQVRSRLGIVSSGAEDGAETRAETCADAGLLIREDGGYRIASWLKWNRSYEEITRVRAQDQQRKGSVDNSLTSKDDGNGSGSGSGNGSGRGTHKRGTFRAPDTDTDTDTEASSSTRKRATQLPVDWMPKDAHLDIAREYGLDPAFELRKFRDHHEAKGTTMKSWDAAFRTWLNNAKTYQRPAARSSGPDWEAAMQRAANRNPNHLEIA